MPCISVSELMNELGHELPFESLADVQAFMLRGEVLSPSSVLTPINLVWPMGFSWSSFIAQSTMTRLCFMAGFEAEQLVTEEGA